MATPTPHPSSLAKRALRRQDPREEPSALTRTLGSVRGAPGNGRPYRDHVCQTRLLLLDPPGGDVRLTAIGRWRMDQVVERPAALDVHKEQVTACVRVAGEGGERREEVREFKTTVRSLLGLRDWLTESGVTHVAMEATGCYWWPVWAILEDGFEVLLCNAAHVKNRPGRKTDVGDSQWLCRLLECGLLRGSFVAPKPVRELRELTRRRRTLVRERAQETNRLHKALEATGIKLDCVATDILGVGPVDARPAARRRARSRGAGGSREGPPARQERGAGRGV